MTLPLTSPVWVFLVISAVILVAPLVTERLRIPGIVGLVVAGLIVGPEGFGLLERSGTIEQLGGLGLLYLMFLAGLELDLDEFTRYRQAALAFGFFTFAIPMTLGTTAGVLLGFATLPSLLIGSLWASHTLVAYPIVRRHGLAGTRSVAVTMGATVITDTIALLVLAVVAESFQTGVRWTMAPRLITGLVLLTVYAWLILPRVASWFFAGMGQDRTLRFVFVLAAFLTGAGLADAVGIEGIVGAFVSGLALNRRVPNRGAFMDRIEFVGSALLIPVFLISVGMLIDTSVLGDPETLLFAATFSIVALAAKWMAAWVAGRMFDFTRVEVGTMFSLSGAQAAATLAATVVAFEIGLFGEAVVNAVLVVILVTVIVTSWTASHYARRAPAPDPAKVKLGEMVVVPVANPETAAPLVRLGSALAEADGGVVVPLHIVLDAERIPGTDHGRLVEHAEGLAAAGGAEAKGLVRIDGSVATGVVHGVLEVGGSLVVLGWSGMTRAQDLLFGSKIDEIVARASVPVIVGRLRDTPLRRVVLTLGTSDFVAGARTDVLLAASVVARLRRALALDVVLIAPASADIAEIVGVLGRGAVRSEEDRVAAASALAKAGDLIVVPGSFDRTVFGGAAAAIAASVPDASVCVVTGPYRSGAFTSGLDFGIPGILGRGD